MIYIITIFNITRFKKNVQYNVNDDIIVNVFCWVQFAKKCLPS